MNYSRKFRYDKRICIYEIMQVLQDILATFQNFLISVISLLMLNIYADINKVIFIISH